MPPEAFTDVVLGLEGDDRAVAAGRTLARALGARPLRLTPEDKARYHAAAALASNGLVALLAVVEEVFSASNRDPETPGSALSLVEPLIDQTLEKSSPGHAGGCAHGPRGPRGASLRSEAIEPSSFDEASVRSLAQVAFELNVSETDPFFTKRKRIRERIPCL